MTTAPDNEWAQFSKLKDEKDLSDLRDHFAAAAMQAIFGGVGAQQVANRDGRYNEDNWAQVVAMNAYEMADAMLAERSKKQ